MYRKYSRRKLSVHVVAQLHAEAQSFIPEQINGSFMVPCRPFPDELQDAFTVVRTQLVGLLPSQQIASHCDTSIAPLRRYHVPLQTNEGCWSFHNGVWQQLKVGYLYQMDPTQPHGAVNWGSEIRLHLMIDVVEGA